MLPKIYRLSCKEIKLRNPQTLRFDDFIIKKSENNIGHLRVGVVISVRVSKSSVERHRIKRQIMESIRLNWNLSVPHDVIIITLPSISTLENKEIQEKIAKLSNLS